MIAILVALTTGQCMVTGRVGSIKSI